MRYVKHKIIEVTFVRGLPPGGRSKSVSGYQEPFAIHSKAVIDGF
jgi:hypothetical protein